MNIYIFFRYSSLCFDYFPFQRDHSNSKYNSENLIYLELRLYYNETEELILEYLIYNESRNILYLIKELYLIYNNIYYYY